MNKTTTNQLQSAIKKVMTEEIIENLLAQGQYSISGLGKFRIGKRKRQKIKNPIAGKTEIPEVFVIKFLPSKKLKRHINARLKITRGAKNG